MTTASMPHLDVVTPWLDLGRAAAEDAGAIALKGYGLWHGFVFGVLEAPLKPPVQAPATAKPSVPAPAAKPAPAAAVVEATPEPVAIAPAVVAAPVKPAKAKVERKAAPAVEFDPAGDFDDALVEKVAPKLLDAPRGVADDLKKIKGIGAKLERLLNDVGVWHYSQIAALTPGEIAWINAKIDFKGRIQRDRWVSQARDLAG